MIYTQNCLQCDKEFESEKPAKYCSANCRVTANRLLRQSQESVTAENVDIGYGPNDYTRQMVEDRLKTGDTFIPNWYSLPEEFLSKNHYKSLAWKI